MPRMLLDEPIEIYFNQDEIRKAFHIPDHVKNTFKTCNMGLSYKEEREDGSYPAS